MPEPPRIQQIAGQTDNHVLLVVIHGAAHAINFSHPGELANVDRLFMADRPIRDDPDSPGTPAPTRSTAASTCLRSPRPRAGLNPTPRRGPDVSSLHFGPAPFAPWSVPGVGCGETRPTPRPRGHR